LSRHPVLGRRRGLLVYLVGWLGFGALLAAFVGFGGGAPAPWAAAFALPLGVLLGFQSLGSWYLVERLPAETTRPARLVGSWLLAGALTVAFWVLVGMLWTSTLLGAGELGHAQRSEILARTLPLLALVGLLGYSMAVLGFYLLAAFERSRAAERRALELQVHAREAELETLKAQLDPHFLFNSLNSVAALIGTDAPAARRMCYLMAGFFRKSLALGRRASIPLAEEIYLAETFLAIEEVRFGERLRSSFEVDEDALTLAVPPLVLQPLVENAVHHGIAHLLEGGVVRLAARRREGRLELEVSNPCDPDRPPSRGAGVGLANVRERLGALYAHRAAVELEGGAESYRVRLLLPAEPAVP
jgi:sensor histidine kinase YesM